MKLQITCEVEDDATCLDDEGNTVPMIDPEHDMGVTEAGHLFLMSRLAFADDIEVEQAG